MLVPDVYIEVFVDGFRSKRVPVPVPAHLPYVRPVVDFPTATRFDELTNRGGTL